MIDIVYDFKTNEYSKHYSNSLVKNDVRTITEEKIALFPTKNS